MRTGRIVGLAICLTAAASALPANAQPPEKGAHRWTVVFQSSTLPADAAKTVSRAGGVVTKAIKEAGVVTAAGDAKFAARLAGTRGILAVGREKSYKLPTVDTAETAVEALGAPTGADTRYSSQWNLRRIGAPAMWARVPMEVQNEATVAVLDTGVMHTHPDLAGQLIDTVATNYCTETEFGSPAYPVYSRLIDFDAHPEWSPDLGCDAAPKYYASHGTHVAGTVAAKFGGAGVVGVAPGLRIAAYKVFDRYRYTNQDGDLVDDVGAFDGPIFQAIVDAALKGYDVINMSLGSAIDRSDSGDNASWLAWDRVAKIANRLGTLIVTSSGNAEQNSNGTIAHVPSDLPTVMSTSATGTSNLQIVGGQYLAAPGSDVLAFYSNYGAAVDVAAPGGDCGPGYPATCVAQYFILSAYIFEDGANIGAAGYAWMAGTSMASPHVAAVAAVVRALHPDWAPGDVRSFLKETAEAIGARQAFGHGLVSADLATR